MNRQGFIALSKKHRDIGTEEYAAIEQLYILLDLDEELFAKIVDAVGVEALVNKHGYYATCNAAYTQLQARERARQDRRRLQEIHAEAEMLRERVKAYDASIRQELGI